MSSLFNLFTNDDLRGLPLYDATWKRGSRMIGVGLFLVAFGIILVGIASANRDATQGSRLYWGLFSLVGLGLMWAGHGKHTQAEQLKRSDDTAELDHLRSLKMTAANKNMKGPRDYKMDAQQLAHELELEVQREVYRQNQREFAKWKLVVGMAGDAMQALLLVEQQLKDNPLYEDLVRKYKGLYDLINDIDPQVKMDRATMNENLENILLAKYAKDQGLDPNVVFGGNKS